MLTILWYIWTFGVVSAIVGMLQNNDPKYSIPTGQIPMFWDDIIMGAAIVVMGLLWPLILVLSMANFLRNHAAKEQAKRDQEGGA